MSEITNEQRLKIQAIIQSEMQRFRPENMWIQQGLCSDCHKLLKNDTYSEKESFLSFYFGMCRTCLYKLLEMMKTTIDQEFADLLLINID